MKRKCSRNILVLALISLLNPNAPCGAAPRNTDDIDELTRAAQAGLITINQNIQSTHSRIKRLSGRLGDLIEQRKVEDIGIAEKIKSHLEKIAEELDRLAKLRETTRAEIEILEKVLERLKEAKTRLLDLFKQKAKTIAGLESAVAEAAEAAEAAARAARAQPILTTIAQDRRIGALFAEFIRSNNRVALNEMLKRENPGSDIDVREVKDTSGLAIFRVGGMTHCLSIRSQCSGKSYSVTQ